MPIQQNLRNAAESRQGLSLAVLSCVLSLSAAIAGAFSLVSARTEIVAASAGAVVLIGVSVCLRRNNAPTWQQTIGGLGCAVVALLGISRLSGVFSAAYPDFDSLFMRVTPQELTALTLLGVSGALMDRRIRVLQCWSQLFALVALVISLLALSGYVQDYRPFVGTSRSGPMSLSLITELMMLSVAIFLARPDEGLSAIVRSRSTAGLAVRALLPLPIGIPFVFSLLNRPAVQRGFYEPAVGSWIFSVTTASSIAAMIWWTAALIRRAEQERQRLEEALLLARDELEEKVDQRTVELRATNQRLTQQNEELEQFGYIACHDLQEPLRILGLYSQLLLRRCHGKLDSDGDEFLRIIHVSAQRMLGLVQSLTVYSHAIHSDDDHKPVDVELVLDQAIARCQALINETGAIVTRSAMPVVLGNECQLAQVFESLLRNSLIYRSERPPVIDVRAEQSSEAWRFSVHDNGIGIDQEHHERVFGLFKRLHGSKYPGNGLGLALCRRIVQRHGSDICLSSAVGQGSIFSFTISAFASDKGTARADAAASR